MTRSDVKTAIQNVVKNAAGVKSVLPYRLKLTPQTMYPIVTVSLPKAKETRMSATAPIGKKKIAFTAQLEIFTIDLTPDGSGQTQFDEMLDAIDAELRKDPTMGGAVLAATIERIDTTVAPPQLVDGQNIALLAIKQFDVTVQVQG